MAGSYEEVVIPLIRLAGPKMRERRNMLDMTMMEVSLRTAGFVTGNFLSALENGKSEGGVTFYRVALLGEVYGLSPHEVLELFGMGNVLEELGLPNTRYRLLSLEEGK